MLIPRKRYLLTARVASARGVTVTVHLTIQSRVTLTVHLTIQSRVRLLRPWLASFDRPRGCERPAETPSAAEPRRRRAVKSGRLQAIARGQEADAPLRSAPSGDCAPPAWRLATMTFLVRDAAGIGRAAHQNGHGCKRSDLRCYRFKYF